MPNEPKCPFSVKKNQHNFSKKALFGHYYCSRRLLQTGHNTLHIDLLTRYRLNEAVV